MFNKTDTDQTADTKKKASIKTSLSMKDKRKEIVEQQHIKTINNYFGNNIIKYLQKLKLSAKAVIFSIAIGTLPVLGIGMIAYSFGSKSISKQIIGNQQNKIISLSDIINRLMLAKYRDIQIISNLPIFTNAEVSKSTTFAEKTAVLNQFIKGYQGYDQLAVFPLNGRSIIQSQGGTSSLEKNWQYFQEVRQKNAPVISQPEILENNEVVIYIAAPIKDIATGEIIAVVSNRISMELLTEAIKNHLDNKDDYYLVDTEGKFFLSLQKDLLGQNATVIYPGLANLLNQENLNNFTGVQTIYQTPQLVSYAPLRKLEGLPELNWQLILAKDAAIALEPQRQFLKVIANITILIALVMTLLVAWLAKSMIKENSAELVGVENTTDDETDNPLTSSKNAELSEKLPADGEGNIQVNRESIYQEKEQQNQTLHLQLLQLISQVESATKGNLKVHAKVKDGEIRTIANIFNDILDMFRDIVIKVKQNASQINKDIRLNQDSINNLADSATTQVKEINRTLATVEQMTNSIQALTAGAQEITAIANHANHNANKSAKAMDLTVENILALQETVGETAKKVKHLGESSQQISRVVSLINQIAIQTNLLAINAGIEAARAGEEGQGFAVVAEEVGELATRSGAATQEIEQIVEQIKRDTAEVVKAMEVGTNQVIESTKIAADAKHSLSEIVDISQQIDGFVKSIYTASVSQGETSEVINQLMKDVLAISQRTSGACEQISMSLQKTADICQRLEQKADNFKVN